MVTTSLPYIRGNMHGTIPQCWTTIPLTHIDGIVPSAVTMFFSHKSNVFKGHNHGDYPLALPKNPLAILAGGSTTWFLYKPV